ncbi:unnamed protein product, partial [Gadus morhua 'NCC']
MTAEVVRTGGTTGGGRGLVTGAIVDCGRLGSGGKAPRSERSSGVAGGGGSGADSSSRSAEMEDGRWKGPKVREEQWSGRRWRIRGRQQQPQCGDGRRSKGSGIALVGPPK